MRPRQRPLKSVARGRNRWRLATWVFGASCSFAGFVAGCASTGLAWVNEPEGGVDLRPPSQAARAEMRSYRPIGSRSAAETFVEPETFGQTRPASHPRLDHTVTLGEQMMATAAPPPVESSSGPSVVNVYVTQSPNTGYGTGYGPGYVVGAPLAGPLFTDARTVNPNSTTAIMRPGLDWPRVPNHGPVFPYRTAPAPAFEGERTRRR
jgi:hypothetical protein